MTSTVYHTDNIDELELLYHLLHKKYPDFQIEVATDDRSGSAPRYIVTVSDLPFIEPPTVPVYVKLDVVYGDTDSVFVRYQFNREDLDANKKDTFKLATIEGDIITDQIFKRPPIQLEFEKVYQPFVLLSKKRYVAHKYDNMRDPLEQTGVCKSGVALTRRDYCNQTKNCYRDMMTTLLSGNSSAETLAAKAVEQYKEHADNIVNYNVPFEDLKTSGLLGKMYSCSLCKKRVEWNLVCGNGTCDTPNHTRQPICGKCGYVFECVHKFSIASVNLATKLLERKEEVALNERIPYMFVAPTCDVEVEVVDDQVEVVDDQVEVVDDQVEVVDDEVPVTNKKRKNAKAKAPAPKRPRVVKINKSELVEDPDYAEEHNLKYARAEYLMEMCKPVLCFLKTALCSTGSPECIALFQEALEHTNYSFELCGSSKTISERDLNTRI